VKLFGKRVSESFVAGDAKSATRFAFFDVLIPAAKDMIVDAVSSGFEKLILGEARRPRSMTTPQAGPMGYVQYHRMGQQSRLPSAQRTISRLARSRHDFDEIILESRPEAELVIEQLFEVVSRYESATVADLYELVGLASTHTDHKWGWTDIRGAGVTRGRDGYVLDLPDPIPLA
jgi:hypothetical protein